LAKGFYNIVPHSKKEANFEVIIYSNRSGIEFEPAGQNLEKILSGNPTSKKDKSWTIDINDIKFSSYLGEGGIGMTYKAVYQSKDVSIKKLPVFSSEDRDYFAKEMGIMRKAKHSCIGVFLGGALIDNFAFMLSNYESNQNLKTVLEKNKEIGWDIKLRMAIQIAKGVNYLHNHKRVHRHLNTNNILIDSELNCKLSDFAFPRRIVSPNVDNMRWCAPEVLLLHQAWSEKSDAYAVALIYWSLLTHEIPFSEAESPYEILRSINSNEMPDFPSGTTKNYRKIVKYGWARIPTNRIGITELLVVLEEKFYKNGKQIADVIDKKTKKK